MLILDLEIIQQGLVVVLRGKAGVRKVAVHVSPFPETAVVKELEFFGDDERHDTVCQAFLEHQEPSNAPVPVLEGMDHLELLMQVNDIFQ